MSRTFPDQRILGFHEILRAVRPRQRALGNQSSEQAPSRCSKAVQRGHKRPAESDISDTHRSSHARCRRNPSVQQPRTEDMSSRTDSASHDAVCNAKKAHIDSCHLFQFSIYQVTVAETLNAIKANEAATHAAIQNALQANEAVMKNQTATLNRSLLAAIYDLRMYITQMVLEANDKLRRTY